MEALAQYNETSSTAKTISAYTVCLRDLHITSHLCHHNKQIPELILEYIALAILKKQNSFVYKVLKTEYFKNFVPSIWLTNNSRY
jgi:hypothetical protein